MTYRILAAAAAVLFIAVGVLSAQPPAPAAAQEPATRTALEGVYSREQVDYGAAIYANNCEMCHGPNLAGRADDAGDAPPLVGTEFYNEYKSGTLETLFTFMKTRMPLGRAGSLRDTEYAGLVAFLLWSNDFPVGQTPLPSTAAELKNIRFEP